MHLCLRAGQQAQILINDELPDSIPQTPQTAIEDSHVSKSVLSAHHWSPTHPPTHPPTRPPTLTVCVLQAGSGYHCVCSESLFVSLPRCRREPFGAGVGIALRCGILCTGVRRCLGGNRFWRALHGLSFVSRVSVSVSVSVCVCSVQQFQC